MVVNWYLRSLWQTVGVQINLSWTVGARTYRDSKSSNHLRYQPIRLPKPAYSIRKNTYHKAICLLHTWFFIIFCSSNIFKKLIRNYSILYLIKTVRTSTIKIHICTFIHVFPTLIGRISVKAESTKLKHSPSVLMIGIGLINIRR